MASIRTVSERSSGAGCRAGYRRGPPSPRGLELVRILAEPGAVATGPNVRGDRTDWHLFLAWGDVHSDGTLRLIRGSKLGLGRVDPRLVEEAMRPGHRLVARIRLTGTPGLTWSAEATDSEPG